MTRRDNLCRLDGCDNIAFGAGLCSKHYFRMRRHGSFDTPKRTRAKQQTKTCVVEGCETSPAAKNMCMKHYMRLRRNGTTELIRKRNIDRT